MIGAGHGTAAGSTATFPSIWALYGTPRHTTSKSRSLVAVCPSASVTVISAWWVPRSAKLRVTVAPVPAGCPSRAHS
jgi:hypothetical protein